MCCTSNLDCNCNPSTSFPISCSSCADLQCCATCCRTTTTATVLARYLEHVQVLVQSCRARCHAFCPGCSKDPVFTEVLDVFPKTAGQTSDQAGSSDGGPSRTGVLQGAGPRIYVGGIPNTVSETMVRNCFSNWGKVCGSCPLQMHVLVPDHTSTCINSPSCSSTGCYASG